MEKIIDYVNETPYNTNIGILKDKLRKYSNELMNNAVKSVNGVTPDEQGNVEIDIPEGFSGEWDDLEGKPFGEEVVKTYVIEPVTPTPLIGYRGMFSLPEFTINIGEVYTVELDGVIYNDLECGAYFTFEDASYKYIGNPTVNTNNLYYDEGEELNPNAYRPELPFCLGFTMNSEIYQFILITDDDAEHTISVYQESTEITSLDPKFLPDEVVTEEELEGLLPSMPMIVFIDSSVSVGENCLKNIDYQSLYSAIESNQPILGFDCQGGRVGLVAGWRIYSILDENDMPNEVIQANTLNSSFDVYIKLYIAADGTRVVENL